MGEKTFRVRIIMNNKTLRTGEGLKFFLLLFHPLLVIFFYYLKNTTTCHLHVRQNAVKKKKREEVSVQTAT